MSAKRSFKIHNSLDGANKGARLTICDVDGKPTEDWLHVLGNDSSTYQTAIRQMRRRIVEYLETKGDDVKKTDDYSVFIQGEQRRSQAALIGGWSFEEPCTPENVVQLLTQAPYIAEQVDEFASKRSRFAKV